jgi:hypothetical protein
MLACFGTTIGTSARCNGGFAMRRALLVFISVAATINIAVACSSSEDNSVSPLNTPPPPASHPSAHPSAQPSAHPSATPSATPTVTSSAPATHPTAGADAGAAHDASPFDIDTGIPPFDAGFPQFDAGALPGFDASFPWDAGIPPFDASLIEGWDVAVPQFDAAAFDFDAAGFFPPFDAAAFSFDGGVP